MLKCIRGSALRSRTRFLVGTLAGIVGALTPIDDIGKMVNIGTLLAFVIVCIAIMVLRKTDPSKARPFRTPWVPLVPMLGILFNGYMMVQAGMAELGAADCLAGYRPDRLLYLQREAQPGAARRGESKRKGLVIDFE